MEEIEAKISSINSKQYYQLGAPSTSYGRLHDEISECGSEDIDTIVHRSVFNCFLWLLNNHQM